MAGTSPILTLGFGPWGGVELLPTLGFGIGEALDIVYPAALDFPSLATKPHYHAADSRPHYRAYPRKPDFVSVTREAW